MDFALETKRSPSTVCAREGARHKHSPGLGPGKRAARTIRGREGGHHNVLGLREIYSGRLRGRASRGPWKPRAERGAKVVERAFARNRAADGKEITLRAEGDRRHLNDVRFFVIVTGLALVTLVLTFVLFRFLQSQAEGQSKLLGGTIKYGGSLAGFVLVFSLLFGAFYKLRADPGVTTPISLAGEWSLELRTSKATVEKGVVTIRQRNGDPVLQMNGELTGEKATTFTTKVGVIRDRSVYFIYENLQGESGIIRGHVPNDTPKALTLVYTDLIGSDRNDDPTGTLVLTRRQ
jgi:hypothetical protein